MVGYRSVVLHAPPSGKNPATPGPSSAAVPCSPNHVCPHRISLPLHDPNHTLPVCVAHLRHLHCCQLPQLDGHAGVHPVLVRRSRLALMFGQQVSVCVCRCLLPRRAWLTAAAPSPRYPKPNALPAVAALAAPPAGGCTAPLAALWPSCVPHLCFPSLQVGVAFALIPFALIPLLLPCHQSTHPCMLVARQPRL